MDCIIAAIAIENRLELFHNDRDFNQIAECTRLKIYAD
jgi:predicted nucleic acid-binding protein